MIAKDRVGLLPSVESVPWLPYEAVLFLYAHLHELNTVFEWGAGASTFFFARHCRHVISVETEKKWWEVMKGLARYEVADNVELHWIPSEDEPGLPKDNRQPTSFRNDKGVCFRKYVQKILEYPDESFDLILVDGKARPSCLITALPKVRRGGYILLDNTDHKKYWEAMRMVPGNYKRTEFSGWGRKDPTMAGSKRLELMNWEATIWRRGD